MCVCACVCVCVRVCACVYKHTYQGCRHEKRFHLVQSSLQFDHIYNIFYHDEKDMVCILWPSSTDLHLYRIGIHQLYGRRYNNYGYCSKFFSFPSKTRQKNHQDDLRKTLKIHFGHQDPFSSLSKLFRYHSAHLQADFFVQVPASNESESLQLASRDDTRTCIIGRTCSAHNSSSSSSSYTALYNGLASFDRPSKLRFVIVPLNIVPEKSFL